MSKKKFDVNALKAAGREAHMQPKTIPDDLIKKIGGEFLQAIPVDSIENNPMQPRISIDDEKLQELAQSIKADSLISPISVFKIDDDKYMLKAGQRRWLAHKILGYKTIKAVVSNKVFENEDERGRVLFEIAMSENIHRTDLDPLELAIAISDAIKKGYYRTFDDAAKGIKKSPGYLSKLMKILHLDSEILDDLKRNKTTSDVEALYYLQKIKDSKRQVALYYEFVRGAVDRVGLRELVNKKVSHAKDAYELKRNNNSISFKADLKRISKEKAESLHSEIEAILNKYYNNI